MTPSITTSLRVLITSPTATCTVFEALPALFYGHFTGGPNKLAKGY